MTEKRFTYEYDEYNGNLFDNKMNTFYPIEDSDENIKVLCDRLNWLVEENEQLKEDNMLLIEDSEKYRKLSIQFDNRNKELISENEQLKQRNNRQAKQLDRLYNLVGEKDWRTLSDILDDFKRCEEQLQKEWGTYGDVE